MRVILGILMFVLILSLSGFASPTTPGTAKTYSTTHSIGIEWPVTGDANHNAACSTQYRPCGATVWKKALPLFRVDLPRLWYGDSTANGAGPYNMFSGSILFLNPNTTYEVKLDILDPDGGNTSRTVFVKTRAIPVQPTGGRTFHVVPGSGGGDGSSANPFKGMAAAEVQAAANDIVLLHAGNYGSYTFTKSGAANGQYIVWKAAGDGEAKFTGLTVASYLWIEGLKISNDNGTTTGLSSGTATDIVILKNQISGFKVSIITASNAAGWYIADNTIVGDHAANSSDISGEGIQLFGKDHEIVHNSITYTSDAISCTYGSNCDFYGNDIFDISDDGIEPDYSYCNIRAWENRITNAYNAAFSLQPMFGAPWYFVRNQVFGSAEPCKLRLVDRFVLAHNTFFAPRTFTQEFAQLLFAGTVKNNIWIWKGCGWGSLWYAAPESLLVNQAHISPYYAAYWKTDVDYNGFDITGLGGSNYPFRWYNGVQNKSYSDLQGFSADVGVGRHGRILNKDQIFHSYTITSVSSDPCRSNAPVQYLTLKSGTNAAIDAGVTMPNINDGYIGAAPDLGAYECGATPVHYGPRHLPVKGGEPPTTACTPQSSNVDFPGDPNGSIVTQKTSIHMSSNAGNLIYHLNGPAHVSIRILDQRGRTVRAMSRQYKLKGIHRLSFENGRRIPNGVYFVQLFIEGQLSASKMAFVR